MHKGPEVNQFIYVFLPQSWGNLSYKKNEKKKCALNCNPGCSLFFGKKENPRTTCMKNRARSSSLLRRHILVCRWNRLTSWSPVMLFVKVLTLWHVGGKQNLVALVCLFFFFFPFAFSSSCGSAVFTKTRQHSICRLPWLQSLTGFSEPKTCFPVQRSPDDEYVGSLLLTV